RRALPYAIGRCAFSANFRESISFRDAPKSGCIKKVTQGVALRYWLMRFQREFPQVHTFSGCSKKRLYHKVISYTDFIVVIIRGKQSENERFLPE
ncbi:MAG: hypothetical protein Q4G48_07890, partial [Bacteroidia bacterium]|nr:hypothetical protein [Bacteroidia bacterium]